VTVIHILLTRPTIHANDGLDALFHKDSYLQEVVALQTKKETRRAQQRDSRKCNRRIFFFVWTLQSRLHCGEFLIAFTKISNDVNFSFRQRYIFSLFGHFTFRMPFLKKFAITQRQHVIEHRTHMTFPRLLSGAKRENMAEFLRCDGVGEKLDDRVTVLLD